MVIPPSLFYSLTSFLPQSKLVSALQGEWSVSSQTVFQDFLGELLGIPCVLTSFAVGDSEETQINCSGDIQVAAGQRTGCHGLCLSQKNKGFSLLPYFFPGDIKFKIRSGGLGSASGREFIQDLPLTFLSPFTCSLPDLFGTHKLSPRNQEAFEADLVSIFKTEAQARLRLEMWPLSSLEEATISEQSVAIIS